MERDRTTMYIIIGSALGATMVVIVAILGFAIVFVGAQKCHERRKLRKQQKIHGEKHLIW